MSTHTNRLRFQYWAYGILLTGLCLLPGATLVSAQITVFGNAHNPSRPPSAYQQRINTALDIADSAAAHGQLEVSLEAVRRAFRNGPPMDAPQIGGLLSGIQATGLPTTSHARKPTVTPPTSLDLMSQRLLALDEVWEEKGVNPEKCYQLWLAITFPKRQTDRIVIFSTAKRVLSLNLSLSPRPPASAEETGISKLIKWAELSNNMEDLRDTVRRRLKSKPSDSDGWYILLKLAEVDETCDRELLLGQVKEHAASLYRANNPEPKLESLAKLVKSVDYQSPARRGVMSNMASTAGLSSQAGRVSWLTYCLLNEASDALHRGDQEVLDQMIKGAISSYHSSNQTKTDSKSASTMLYTVAMHNAFASGDVDVALFCMAREQALATDTAERTLGDSRDLLAVASKTFQSLFAMPTSQRYDLLNRFVWTLPNFGLENLSTFAPTEEIPVRFVQAYKRKYGVDQLPIEAAVGLSGHSLSLLEWHMRDAIALGRREELERRIGEIEEKAWKGANLVRAVYQAAQNKPIDIEPLIVGNGDERGILPLLTAEYGVILPVHLDIIESACQKAETRELASDFARRLIERGLRLRNNIVLQGRHALAECRLPGPEPRPDADSLRHFAQFDDFRYGTMCRGLPLRGVWHRNDAGDWEHQACNTRSSLFLKYPLAGKFQVQFDCQDGSYASCGATAMGILYDFKGYARTIGLETVGLRKRDSRIAAGVSGTAPFSVQLDFDTDAGSFTMSTGEHPLGKYYLAKGQFPFVGAQSMMHRKMALKNFRVQGDYTIPRSVDLTAPDLWGWSNLFHARSLPATHEFVRVETSVKSSAPAEKVEGPATVAYDWHVADGVIESIDHKARYEQDKAAGLDVEMRDFRPDEEWLYYSRQLCDQEKVSLEFYQDAGKYSLHPTVDRVAFKLGKVPQEHWITSDESLYGLKGDDYFDVPENRVMESVEPIEKQWNQLELHRDGKWITISLNGKPACRTVVDSNYDGRFGLLCVPKDFHVRVRGAKLTGPWPEKLPDRLLETID